MNKVILPLGDMDSGRYEANDMHLSMHLPGDLNYSFAMSAQADSEVDSFVVLDNEGEQFAQ